MDSPISHPDHIRRAAYDLVVKIAARPEILLDGVLQIHITAITRREYTRSLALLGRLIIDGLNQRNKGLGKAFQDEIVDLAVSTYFQFWNSKLDVPQDDSTTDLVLGQSDINASAISAYIGDLTSIGIMSVDIFERMGSFLLEKMTWKKQIFVAYHLANMTLLYFRVEEEALLKRLVNYLRLNSQEENVWPQHCDNLLDIEEALMASVCFEPQEATNMSPCHTFQFPFDTTRIPSVYVTSQGSANLSLDLSYL